MSIEQREVVRIATGEVETLYCEPIGTYGYIALLRKPNHRREVGFIQPGRGTHAYHIPEREPQAQRIRDDIATVTATLERLRRALAAVYADTPEEVTP